MGALKTCCGFYCSMTAMIGIYFFAILAVMEYRGNTFLVQIVQNEEHETIDNMMKAQVYAILAGVEVVLMILCFCCGRSSLNQAQIEEENEKAEYIAGYGVN